MGIFTEQSAYQDSKNDKQKKDIAITGIATLILIAFVCIFSFGSLIDALKNMFAN
ncbi:MAG: hypothetical protein IJ141_00155 [Lachnospiraceae bacterium]|nr:hypothetical protein [Lachnospiraceae bacterium]